MTNITQVDSSMDVAASNPQRRVLSPQEQLASKVAKVASGSIYENKQDALDAIRSAAKEVSTVRVPKENLVDEWNGTAQVPGALQLLYTPYRLGKYVYQKINLIRCPALETTKPKIFKDMVQIVNLAVYSLLSLAFVGVSVGAVAFATPILLITGFLIAILETGMEVYKTYHFKQFVREFNANSFKTLDVLKGSVKKHNILKPQIPIDYTKICSHLCKIVQKDAAAPQQLKEKLLEMIREISSEESFSNQVALIEKELLQAHLENLQNKFFKLSGQEIEQTLHEAEIQLDQTKYANVLPSESPPSSPSDIDPHFDYSKLHISDAGYNTEIGLQIIDKRFEKKQQLLARYVQPWLVEKITASYQELLTQLQKSSGEEGGLSTVDTVDNAKTMLYAMDEVTRKREQVHFTNMIQWVLNTSYLVCMAVIPQVMMVSALLFLSSLLLGFFNGIVHAWGVNKQDPAVAKVVDHVQGKTEDVASKTLQNLKPPEPITLPRPDAFTHLDLIA